MSVEIIFAVSDSLKSIATAAGIDRTGDEIPPCPLQIGDVISDPTAPGLFFRVASRWISLASDDKPPRWFLTLEQAPDPLASLDRPRESPRPS